MSSELHTEPDRSRNGRFAVAADGDRVRRTAAALEANGISVLRASDAEEAKRVVLGLIPAGSQVHMGASQSLEVSGIVEEIERPGRYEPVRPRMFSMDRETQADEIRRFSSDQRIQSHEIGLSSSHLAEAMQQVLGASQQLAIQAQTLLALANSLDRPHTTLLH